MDLYTLIDEHMIDCSPGYYCLVGVFLSLEAAQAAALAWLSDPSTDQCCDGRRLSLTRSLADESKGEWLGDYNPQGEWLPARTPAPVGFWDTDK